MAEDETKLPYVVQYKKIPQYFDKILEVETPEKFTYNFLEDVMLFKSVNDRNLVSLLKKMEFLDEKGNPTSMYIDYKISELSKKTLAKGIKNAYKELFRRKTDFHVLDEAGVRSYVKAVTGYGDDSSVLPLVVKTFLNLRDLADFSESETKGKEREETDLETKIPTEQENGDTSLKLNYTITINLPITNNQEVYDKIFGSIKKTLLSK